MGGSEGKHNFSIGLLSALKANVKASLLYVLLSQNSLIINGQF